MGEVYVKRTKILEKGLDDELLLIDNEADVIFNLNPLGTAVWRFLDTPRKIDEILKVLCTAFPDIPEAQIKEDTLFLLGQLVNSQLLEVRTR